MDIKYIDDDVSKGIEYDWNSIWKYCRQKKLFSKKYYIPKRKAAWNVVCSERGTGKTTAWLLVGLVMNRLYGTRVHLIREDEDMIFPKRIKNMFDTILNLKSIDRIYEGEWNSITYKARRWYLCNVDDEGKITEMANECVVMCMSLDENEKYKSSYNSPSGDLIIFDEFISNRYMRGDFIALNNIISTVFRERLNGTVVLLANTIDANSEYFDELEAREYIEKMEIGDSVEYKTSLGTDVFLEIYNATMTKRKRTLNSLYFGFKNPLLNSIRGGDWSFKSYQHINFEKVEKISTNHYVLFNGKYLQLEFCVTEIGLAVLVHYANEPYYADSVIYTNQEIDDYRKRYKFGFSKFDAILWRLYKLNRFYYANNMIGSMLEKYVDISEKL